LLGGPKTQPEFPRAAEAFSPSQNRIQAVIRFPHARHSFSDPISAWSPLSVVQEKELAQNRVRASSVEFVFYANLVAIVMMIPLVPVNPMPVPVVRRARGIAIVSIRSVVPIRVIAIVIRIVVIAIRVSWMTKSDSYAADSD
jgi:hypothetical protein